MPRRKIPAVVAVPLEAPVDNEQSEKQPVEPKVENNSGAADEKPTTQPDIEDNYPPLEAEPETPELVRRKRRLDQMKHEIDMVDLEDEEERVREEYRIKVLERAHRIREKREEHRRASSSLLTGEDAARRRYMNLMFSRD